VSTMKRSLTILAGLCLFLLADSAHADRYRYHRHRYGYGYSYGYATATVAPVVAVSPVSWYLGLGALGVNVMEQDGGPEPLENGGGGTLFLGVRLSRVFALEVSWLGSFHDPNSNKWIAEDSEYLVLEGFTADMKLHITNCAGIPMCFDPYVTGGVGLYALGFERMGADSVGGGFQVGGGFDYWLGSSVTLGLRARYHGIAMGPPESEEADLFLHAASVDGNIALHF
jgi:opacity protein-like surface antigen